MQQTKGARVWGRTQLAGRNKQLAGCSTQLAGRITTLTGRSTQLAGRSLRWKTAAPALLQHVNLLLAMCAGAGLATAARLKWDPSTYVALRQLFPLEYRVAAVVLCAAAVALLALAHLAALALAAGTRPATRRYLMITYAGSMMTLMCAELWWVSWSCVRVTSWLRSERAAQLAAAARALVDAKSYLRWIISFLNDHVADGLVPQDLVRLLDEVEADVPRNLYAAASGVALVCVLQPAAAALAALCAAAPAPPEPAPSEPTPHEPAPPELAPGLATTPTPLQVYAGDQFKEKFKRVRTAMARVLKWPASPARSPAAPVTTTAKVPPTPGLRVRAYVEECEMKHLRGGC